MSVPSLASQQLLRAGVHQLVRLSGLADGVRSNVPPSRGGTPSVHGLAASSAFAHTAPPGLPVNATGWGHAAVGALPATVFKDTGPLYDQPV